jgi:serine/threonine-protein kinase HipA
MSKKVIQVCVGDAGLTVGTLWFENQEHRQFSRFQYAETWVGSPLAFPLAPSMPLGPDPLFFRSDDRTETSMPLPLMDAIPDSWGRKIVRSDAVVNDRSGSGLTELDYLLSVDDFIRHGALRFRDPEATSGFLSCDLDVGSNCLSLKRMDETFKAITAFEKRREIAPETMSLLNKVGTALGGARPKCTLIDRDGTLLVAKFTSEDDLANIEVMEVATLELAARCGLRVPRARIRSANGQPVALIQRFDRMGGRQPYISARTFLAKTDASPGNYVDLTEAMRLHSADPQSDIRELFARVAFSILVSNVDDHLRNHGFLHDGGGKWRLSPIFDINPSPERHRQLKTHISRISGPEASIGELLDHASFFDLDITEAAHVIAGIASTVSSEWVSIGRRIGLTSGDISHYRPAFEHADMEIALKVARDGILSDRPRAR